MTVLAVWEVYRGDGEGGGCWGSVGGRKGAILVKSWWGLVDCTIYGGHAAQKGYNGVGRREEVLGEWFGWKMGGFGGALVD